MRVGRAFCAAPLQGDLQVFFRSRLDARLATCLAPHDNRFIVGILIAGSAKQATPAIIAFKRFGDPVLGWHPMDVLENRCHSPLV